MSFFNLTAERSVKVRVSGRKSELNLIIDSKSAFSAEPVILPCLDSGRIRLGTIAYVMQIERHILININAE